VQSAALEIWVEVNFEVTTVVSILPDHGRRLITTFFGRA
jgi:hypothetical protein